MSALQPWIPGARVLDLCAGSGGLGLEALSRGAAHCDFVERDARVLEVLGANVARLGATSRAAMHRAEATRFVAARSAGGAGAAPWDLAFADPPYREGIAEALAALWLERPFATIFGVEHEATLTLPDADAATVDRRRYGDTAVTIYRPLA